MQELSRSESLKWKDLLKKNSKKTMVMTEMRLDLMKLHIENRAGRKQTWKSNVEMTTRHNEEETYNLILLMKKEISIIELSPFSSMFLFSTNVPVNLESEKT